eukprot:TRINITY_DN3500_c0_g1_i1.p1 TRINITY_DN3500_c0_g1~~TRINITY_DN3500_c0_g1_i1.p1  ORF type:complete len:535 (+),score=161.94 TRINITY_DN3500_c0_g1_i1:36-1640(+)
MLSTAARVSIWSILLASVVWTVASTRQRETRMKVEIVDNYGETIAVGTLPVAVAKGKVHNVQPPSAYCKSMSEVYPGRAEGDRWRPQECLLREKPACPLLRKVAVLGDEVTRRLGEALQQAAPSNMLVIVFNTTQLATNAVLREMDAVLYGAGHDVAQRNRVSLSRFYNESAAEIWRLKQIVGVKKLAVNLPHHFDREGCASQDSACYRCADPVQAAAYREALRSAAACNKISVFNFEDLTKVGTRGGQLRMKANIVANWVCGGGGFTPSLPGVCVPDADLLARWSTMPASVKENCGVPVCNSSREVAAAMNSNSHDQTVNSPMSCSLPTRSDLRIRKCLEGKQVVFFGDGGTRNLMESLMGVKIDPTEHHIYTEQGGKVSFLSSPCLDIGCEPGTHVMFSSRIRLVRTADLIVYGMGSRFNTPVVQYADMATEIVEQLKLRKKESAKLVLYPTPSVPASQQCFTAYQKAFHLSAGCNQIPVLPNHPSSADLLANYLCRKEEGGEERFHLHVPVCNPSETQAEWAAVPALARPC